MLANKHKRTDIVSKYGKESNCSIIIYITMVIKIDYVSFAALHSMYICKYKPMQCRQWNFWTRYVHCGANQFFRGCPYNKTIERGVLCPGCPLSPIFFYLGGLLAWSRNKCPLQKGCPYLRGCLSRGSTVITYCGLVHCLNIYKYSL